MPDETHSSFGNAPQPSEGFGKLPHDSEPFRNVPNPSESFRMIPKASERKENHILTVREVARMFESAGVSRTERSIVNWCQPNSAGIARLDAYLDPNEGKYFITSQSAEAAIKEEQAKYSKPPAPPSEPFRNEQPVSEPAKKSRPSHSEDDEEIAELHKELMDLKITNRAKDQFIQQLQGERSDMLDKLVANSRVIGQLETKLLQIEGPSLRTNSSPDETDLAL
jgi:hypothetical protein